VFIRTYYDWISQLIFITVSMQTQLATKIHWWHIWPWYWSNHRWVYILVPVTDGMLYLYNDLYWAAMWSAYTSGYSQSNIEKSNSIKLNQWTEFDWVRQSNKIEHQNLSEFDFQTNTTQSNKLNTTESNSVHCVLLSSATELNWTQSNGLCSVVFSE